MASMATAVYLLKLFSSISGYVATAKALARTSAKELTDIKYTLDASSTVAITDRRGKITYVNDKFCEISKYSRSEPIGQDHRIINSGHHSKSFFQGLGTTISRGKVWSGEIKSRAKDGSYYWVATFIVPFPGDNGKPYQYVAIRTDITQRKQAEEKVLELNRQLRQSIEELNTLMEILPVGVWIGNADCSKITGNPAAYRIMGFSPGVNASMASDAPEIPANLRIFFDGKEVAPQDAPVQQVARTGKPLHNFEHEVQFSDEKGVATYGSKVPLFDEGARAAAHCSLR